ncbi:MAG: enoyl-CoA hydratase/isomerase family protein [Gemmatimonadetes bacterium]|nr:enoyl-CoA hydratase/isomerase family protein [Gemmatimonadota bacterium]
MHLSTAPARLDVEDGIAVIRLNEPGKPVNVLSGAMVGAMRDIIERLEAREGGARAAVIVSEKPGIWIAGADIEEFGGLETAADGERMSRAGHDLLGRLERLPIPVVAAIDGAALGGGLEVALACTYRVASDSPKTKLGLPEVQLGILPGAGGTQRLPRLVGVRAALELMLTGKQLDARRAKKIGLVDEVVAAPALLRAAKQIAHELVEGKREPTPGRPKGSPQWVETLPGMRQIIFRKAREGVMSKTKGLYPAPLKILEVVERGLDRPLEEGLALEAQAFGELSVTPEARALVHLFFATTAAKNAPAEHPQGAKIAPTEHPQGAKNAPVLPEGTQPRKIERLAVVGAGFMGAGIAAVSAESGIPVRLKDVTPEGAARGLKTARGILTKRAKRKRRRRFEVTRITDRVQATHEYTGFGQVEMVVEAVFEDVDLKHRVIREIEDATGEDVILGTNTSTIPITRLAEAARRPRNVIGLHFFSPVEKMPLLEIITTGQTAPEVTAACHQYGKKIGKTPIIVSDSPGFYANRILTPYMNEATLLLQEGVSIEEVDSALTSWGMAVGPITLYDEVGLDVATKAGKIMAEAFSDRLEPNAVLERLVEDGRLGRKNGRGFYLYKDGKKGEPDSSVYALIGSPARREVPRRDIRDRVALMMVNEAVRTLEEGVIHNARDGDVGAVLGLGFAPFRGGPFWHIDQAGASTIVARLRELERTYGARFAPAALLVEKAEAGERFSNE